MFQPPNVIHPSVADLFHFSGRMSSLSRGASSAGKPKAVNVNSLYSGRNLAAGGKPPGKPHYFGFL